MLESRLVLVTSQVWKRRVYLLPTPYVYNIASYFCSLTLSHTVTETSRHSQYRRTTHIVIQ